MLKICALASGSRGNSIYVSDGTTSLLIDCGLSLTCLKSASQELGFDLGTLSSILITHEHTDHIAGVAALSNRYGIEAYAHAYVHNAIKKRQEIINRRIIENGRPFEIGSLKISAFKTPHDSVFSLGYRIEDSDGFIFAYATDLGYVSDSVLRGLSGADAVMLESNHDIDMLKKGSYPEYLKRRILSQTGHLSNAECSRTVLNLVEKGTKTVILGHISQENNLYELAEETTFNALMCEGAEKEIKLVVAYQNQLSDMVEI